MRRSLSAVSSVRSRLLSLRGKKRWSMGSSRMGSTGRARSRWRGFTARSHSFERCAGIAVAKRRAGGASMLTGTEMALLGILLVGAFFPFFYMFKYWMGGGQ